MLTLIFFLQQHWKKKLLHRVLSNPDKLSSWVFVFLSGPEASCLVSRWRFRIIQSTHQRHRYDTALNRPRLVQTRISQILRPRNAGSSTRLLKHSWEYKRWDNVSGMGNTPLRTPPSCTLACMQHTRTKNTHTQTQLLPWLLGPLSGLRIRAMDCAQLLPSIPDKNQAISQSVAFFHPLIHSPHTVQMNLSAMRTGCSELTPPPGHHRHLRLAEE